MKEQTGAARLRELPDGELQAECRWEAFRGPGPGGQKRNKTSSAVRIVHVPTGLCAVAMESRSQSENRRRALQRLRHRLTLELRQVRPGEAFTVPGWFQSLPDPAAALRTGLRSGEYLRVLGLVLDVLEAAGWRVSDAAAMLRVSTAQLVHFLERDVKAWGHVNIARAKRGLRPLTSA